MTIPASSMAGNTELRWWRADHVGSLLRPPHLLALRQAMQRGEVTAQALRAQEEATC